MPRPRYRPWPRRPRLRRHAPAPGVRRGRGLLLPALVGMGLALLVISRVDAALRPTLTALAQANVRNAITQIVNDAVQATLASEAVSYGDLVTVKLLAGFLLIFLAVLCSETKFAFLKQKLYKIG